jgi:hypothetical protein
MLILSAATSSQNTVISLTPAGKANRTNTGYTGINPSEESKKSFRNGITKHFHKGRSCLEIDLNSKKAVAKILLYFFPGMKIKLLKNCYKKRLFACHIGNFSHYYPIYVIRLYKRVHFANAAWVAIFEDSFAGYIGNSKSAAELYKREEKVFDKADLIFLMPELLNDSGCYYYKKYKSKIVPLCLATLQETVTNGADNYKQNDTVQCLYIGSLQDKRMRDPTGFFKTIISCNNSIKFKLVVTKWSADCDILRQRYLTGKSNVEIVETLSHDECMMEISRSDILINIGNNAVNQLPSKIMEYISYGKPLSISTLLKMIHQRKSLRDIRGA